MAPFLSKSKDSAECCFPPLPKSEEEILNDTVQLEGLHFTLTDLLAYA